MRSVYARIEDRPQLDQRLSHQLMTRPLPAFVAIWAAAVMPGSDA
jgi:hypothetical protein